MKKLAVLIMLLCLCFAACTKEQPESTTTTAATEETTETVVNQPLSVGVSLPAADTQYWAEEGAELRKKLLALGYQVTLAYGENDPQRQAEQIDKMITEGVDCLVIAGIDSLSLSQTLDRAKAQQIPVIAYDRMLMHSDAVRFCVAPDARGAGTAMAEYVVDKLQLATAKDENRSYRIELFMGAPENANSLMIYRGVMDVLQSYLDSGVLASLSGRTSFEDSCVPDWSADGAKEDCADYLKNYYGKQKPDILFAASDALASGVVAALEREGYLGKENKPLVTGCGADEDAVVRLTEGTQSMTLYMDRQLLVQECVSAVEALLQTGQLPTADTVSEHNGNVQVPAKRVPLVTVTAENHTEVLPQPVEEEVPPTTTTSPTETQAQTETTKSGQ